MHAPRRGRGSLLLAHDDPLVTAVAAASHRARAERALSPDAPRVHPTRAELTDVTQSSRDTSATTPAPFTPSPHPTTTSASTSPSPPLQTSSSPIPHGAPVAAAQTRIVSARTLWRPRGPRPMPPAAASLLPTVSATASPAAPRSQRLPRTLGKLGAASSVSGLARTPGDVEGRYLGEYDRLIFSATPRSRCESSSSGLVHPPAVADLPAVPARPAPSSALDAERRAAAPTAAGCITASQAAAVLGMLSATSPSATAMTTPSRPVPTTSLLVSPPPSRQRRSVSAVALLNDPHAAQPEAWWSTLDGTLSAAGLHGAGAPAQPPTGALLHPSFSPNLNNTLGRADRAAMVLSMQQRSPTASAALPPVYETRRGGGGGGGDGVAEAAEEEPTSPTSRAIANLAARLSRATAPPSAGTSGLGPPGATSTVLSEASSHRRHPNTMQELRDTLRLTQSLTEGHVQSIRFESGVQAPPETDRRVSASLSFGAKKPVALRGTLAARRTAAPGSDGMGSASIGGGTQRIRDALARLYGAEATATAVQRTPSVTSSRDLPLPPHSSHDLAGTIRGADERHRTHRLDHAASGAGGTRAAELPMPDAAPDAVAAAASLQLPWLRESLTVDAIERRFGLCDATHVRSGSRAQHRVGVGNAAVDLTLLVEPAASSVSTSDFSGASLTSTIFAREVVDVVAVQRGVLAVASRVRGARANTQQSRAAVAAATKAYRQEQLRLYASGLATPATLLAATAKGEVDVLDVDDLFREPPAPAQAGAPGGARTVNLDDAAAASPGATGEGRLKGRAAASSRRGPTSGPAPAPCTAATEESALERALRARKVVLSRYRRERPAWERTLHNVRQWCDRTRVMVRFDNGVCVEQVGASHSHVALARKQKQQQKQQQPSQEGQPVTRLPSAATVRSGASEAQQETVPSPSPSPPPIATGGGTGADDKAGWGHYVYADDPIAAHDAVMLQVAEEEQEVRRQMALALFRQRRRTSSTHDTDVAVVHGRPAATSASARPAGGADAAPQSPAVSPHPHGGGGPGAMSGWGLMSVVSSANALDGGIGGVAGVGLADAATQANVRVLSRLFNDTMTLLSSPDPASLPVGAVMAGVHSNRALARPPPMEAMHAALCARLQTWGGSISDDEVLAPAAEEAETGGGGGASSEPRRSQGSAVFAQSSEAKRSSTVQRARSSVTLVSVDSSPFLRATRESGDVAPTPLIASLQPHSRRPSTVVVLSKAERDLLCFVLTCACGGTMSGSSGEPVALLALRHPSVLLNTTEAGALPALPHTQQALAALRVMQLQRLSVSALLDESRRFSREATPEMELRASYGVLRQSRSNSVSPAPTQTTPSPSRSRASDAPTPEVGTGVAAAGGPLSQSAASAPAPPDTPSVPWSSLVGMLLTDYNPFDLLFLRQVHYVLWQCEQEMQPQYAAAGARASLGSDGLGGAVSPQPRRVRVSSLLFPSPAARESAAPPPVLPVTLHYAAPGAGGEGSEMSPLLRPIASASASPPPLVVDVAELLGAIAGTALLRWLCDAQRQSPTGGWLELTAHLPLAHAAEWQAALARCAGALGGEPQRSFIVAANGSTTLQATPSGEARRSWVRSPTNSSGPTALSPPSASTTRVLESFTLCTSLTVEAAAWRLRILHALVHRASVLAERERAAADGPPSGSASPELTATPRLGAAAAATGGHAESFPRVGETPYVPEDKFRSRYPLDMRNLYLISSLAVENADARVAPQLQDVCTRYADAYQAAMTADAAAAERRASTASSSSPMAAVARAATGGLPAALQQRVHIDRLWHLEQRHFALSAALWSVEQSVTAFNHHVGPFNAFTASEQRRWGQLYCSSLTVAYFVCEELLERGMEGLAADLLPFVSVVATFTGCRGGHRELLVKLKSVMLELTERAKRVEVPLESLSWHKRRPHVLAEAAAAAKLASRRAAGVVSCLATEADAVVVPLTELAMPSLSLSRVPPLSPVT